jgi:DnaJ-class molecular chaperone
MIWYIDGEEYVFDSWEELGTALRDLSRNQSDIRIKAGSACEECNGQGTIVAFASAGSPIHMECAECNATGIEHWKS